MKLLGKMSVKSVFGKIKPTEKAKDEDGDDILIVKERAIIRVVGIASGKREGSSDFGDYIEFHGQFQATNLETGEVFRSGKLFLPDICTALIAPTLESANAVEFAFDLGVKHATTPIGYEYTAEPLIETGEADQVSLLAGKITKALPNLDPTAGADKSKK